MYACGLRISEATTLEVSAIDRANQVLRIVGKGNKERLACWLRSAMSDLPASIWIMLPPERRGRIATLFASDAQLHGRHGGVQ